MVAGVPDESCFTTLERLVTGKQVFLSLYLYIEVLQSLGLVIFNNNTKGITLTEKGMVTAVNDLLSYRILVLLFLCFLRRVFLFILFWPMFIFIQKTYNPEE